MSDEDKPKVKKKAKAKKVTVKKEAEAPAPCEHKFFAALGKQPLCVRCGEAMK